MADHVVAKADRRRAMTLGLGVVDRHAASGNPPWASETGRQAEEVEGEA